MRARTPKAKTLFRMHLSATDFSQAVRFIDAARNAAPTSDERWGLLLAAIVCYARPFSPNERRLSAAADSRLQMDAKMLRTILANTSDRKLHRRILRLRNKVVAHSESKYSSFRLLGATASAVTFRSVAWHPFDEQIDLFAFRRIAEAFETYCGLGRHALGDAVLSDRKRQCAK